MVSSQIQLLKKGKKALNDAFNHNIMKLKESIKMLYGKIYSKKEDKPKSGLGSVFGLEDPENFIKPPPPDFAHGLNKDDFSSTFSKQ